MRVGEGKGRVHGHTCTIHTGQRSGCAVYTYVRAASIHDMQEIQELQAQVGDLMFYLDTQKKVASTADGMKQVSAWLFVVLNQ